ncbi:MAG TPA: sensor domain-containing diguanylate cyclase [Dehalococcoidia bacterium]|nr:sensor domain-containing diguanylate cyclase [Dehalococcoidia bacterium]
MSLKAVFALQLAVLAATFTAGILGVVIASGMLHDDAKGAGEVSKNALTVSNGEALLGDMLIIAVRRASAFLLSPAFTSLDPSTQSLVRNELFRTDGEPPAPSVPPVEIPLSLKDGLTVQNAMNSLVESTRFAFAAPDPDPTTVAIGLQLQATVKSLQDYFAAPTVSNYRTLVTNLASLRIVARDVFPALDADSKASFARLESRLLFGRNALVLGLIGIGVNAFIMTLFMGRRLQLALEKSQSESQSLAYRNSQLNALYAVFNEITDSLSLRYVVAATVRESQRLVSAHAVSVRLVRQDELVVEGSGDQDGNEVDGLSTVLLGEGPVGRAARRGKTLRVDDRIGIPSEGDWGADMRSGLIVPLIVGARVVGTLACWSREADAFSDDDQRVMEMMASQVATAVAAAESTELYQRRARLDPLTGLYNRRELDQDLQGFLAELEESGRKATVAMADIDHFKRFNDDYGHHVGDVTLQKVAAVMRNSLRETDRMYRYGGEEFMAVMVDANREQSLVLAERIRAAVEATPLSGESMEPVGPITVSIGLSLFPEHAHDFSVLIELADEAMYQSKQNGRNQVTLWSASLQKAPMAA